MPGRNVEQYAEVVGQQLRIRVHAPAHYARFYTDRKSKNPKWRRSIMGVKAAGQRSIQSYRLNLSRHAESYARAWVTAVPCSWALKRKARRLAGNYYKNKKGRHN